MKAWEFDGTTVFVVGGSLGIGLAVARTASSLGADVVIFARRQGPLGEAAADVERHRKRAAQRIAWRQLDVADAAQVGRVMDATVAEVGVPDVLINCAGRAYPDYFENISPERCDDTMRVNLHGCWNTVSALVPHMKQRGRGYIVNTSSVAGLLGVFGYTDYCASKFALVGFSEALRSELRPHGIVVSVLCPPDTQTPGFDKENETKPPETRALSAAARLLTPERVAAALIAGMARESFLIVPGTAARLVVLAKRLAPWLVEGVMTRQVRKVARSGKARQS